MMEKCTEGDVLGIETLEAEFDTMAYLVDFYQQIDDPAMQMMLMLLPNIVQRIEHAERLLDFGAGPTIHVSAAFRNKVDEIYLADFLPQNREELSRWVNGVGSFNWTATLMKLCTAEGNNYLQLKEMEKQAMSKVRGIFHCDCHVSPSVAAPKQLLTNFDIVVSILCLEYCNSTEFGYRTAVKNVVEQVKPGGVFIMGGVLEEHWCSFGGRKFACYYLTEETMLAALRECGLLIDDPKATIYYNANGVFLLCTRKAQETSQII